MQQETSAAVLQKFDSTALSRGRGLTQFAFGDLHWFRFHPCLPASSGLVNWLGSVMDSVPDITSSVAQLISGALDLCLLLTHISFAKLFKVAVMETLYKPFSNQNNNG